MWEERAWEKYQLDGDLEFPFPPLEQTASSTLLNMGGNADEMSSNIPNKSLLQTPFCSPYHWFSDDLQVAARRTLVLQFKHPSPSQLLLSLQAVAKSIPLPTCLSGLWLEASIIGREWRFLNS